MKGISTMENESDIKTKTQQEKPSEIFLQIGVRFAWLGAKYGTLYGMGYGAIYGFVFGMMLGAAPGLFYGSLIGAMAGTAMGVIGAAVLGAFSVLWGRGEGGVLSDRHTANRDGYRRGVLVLAVVTTVPGSLFLFPPIGRVVYPQIWEGSGIAYLSLALVPSLIAGFAAYQAGRKIIAWYEGNVGHPRNIMLVGPSQEGVWPPPPIRSEEKSRP